MTLRELAHRLPLHHEMYVVGLTLLGRNRCSLLRSLRENSAYRRKHEASMASIAARSRVAARDPRGLVSIDTPYGNYWTPAGMDLFSPLAERAIDLYTSDDHGVQAITLMHVKQPQVFHLLAIGAKPFLGRPINIIHSRDPRGAKFIFRLAKTNTDLRKANPA